MQLGKLRSAIRAHKGTINVQVTLGGVPVKIPVQKSGFLNDVLPQFASEKTGETDLSYDDGLVFERAVNRRGETMPANEPIDLMDDGGAEVQSEDETEFEDLFG